MHLRGLIIWLMFNVYWRSAHGNLELYKSQKEYEQRYTAQSQEHAMHSGTDSPSSHQEGSYDTCSLDDFSCLAMAQSDRLGLEAIRSLHKQLDDDKDGNIDLSESDDFLKEELKYNSGHEKRQKNFHRNDDMHISVKELWEAWLKSEVHNWTVEQTTDWLFTCVELPQYVDNFIQHKVTGANLPRLAVNNANYLAVLGIKDPIHKQKIALKAMDVVLFGSPKDGSHWKDLTLIFLSIVGLLGVYYAYQQNKKFRDHLNRMNKDMDSLQNAEKALTNLQKELEEAKQVKESVITEKQNLEKKLQDSKSELGNLPSSHSDLEVSQLKAEIEMLRTELQLAEGELKDRYWAPPPALQQWLQLTHETENKSYLKKKISAEKQLLQAKEACDKLKKKRSSLIGAFVSTHGKSIDDVDRSIVQARTALNEVTHELQERVHRWKQIETLCGFNIINNNGYAFLENALYRNSNGRTSSLRGRMNSTDDLDDETASVYSSYAGHVESSLASAQWKDGDSSSSEGKPEEDGGINDVKSSSRNNVHFQVGSEVSPWNEDASPSPTSPNQIFIKSLSSHPKSISQSNIALNPPLKDNPIVRSYSQDVSLISSDPKPSKISHSDLHQETQKGRMTATNSTKPSDIPEDDICSTDSSVLDDGDTKKKKRKLFNFSTKKNKNKGD